MTVRLPPKDRYDLPEVLELVKPFGCRREDLFEYLCAGDLQTFACPYRLEPLREVPIGSDEWRDWFREPWDFPVYADWIGDMDIGKHKTLIPLHIIPRAARADCERVLKDGGKAASTATVFVSRRELMRFINWLRNPSKTRPGPRRPGAGRPVNEKYREIYTEIDRLLEKLYLTRGRSEFERPRDVVAHVKAQLGETRLPPDSTLRNHIKRWLDKRSA